MPPKSAPLRLTLRLLACCLAAAWAPAAWAQASGLRLQPTLNLGVTVTDSHDFEDGIRRGEVISTVGAGLAVTSNAGRLRGGLTYRADGVVHARDTPANALLHSLQSSAVAELLERQLFMDVSARVSQQPVSTRQVQTVDSVLTERNRAQLASINVQPRFEFQLGRVADGRLAASGTYTRPSGDADREDSGQASASFSLVSAGVSKLGWNASATRNVSQFRGSRRATDDRLVAGADFKPDVDWRFSVRGGVDYSDINAAGERRRYDSWGAGVDWTPSPRTRATLQADKRSFGDAFGVSLEHRSRQTVWRYSDQQDISRSGANDAVQLASAYDLFFALYASQEPDPVKRQELVESVLVRNGLQRDAQLAVGFLSNSITLQRRQQASVLLQTVRTSYSLSAFASRTRRVEDGSLLVDDTANGNSVMQRGLSLQVSHRVTPTAALTGVASWQRNSDSEAGATPSTLKSLSLSWSDRLGPRTAYSLGLRHADYFADTDPYTENALIANLSLRF